MHNRPYDIIVFGATGFTGKLVVEYLIEHYGVNNELFTWAIAGRNEDKIKKVISSKTKVIIPVHLYGQMCKMDIINKIAKRKKITIIEDAAEVIGQKYNNKFHNNNYLQYYL